MKTAPSSPHAHGVASLHSRQRLNHSAKLLVVRRAQTCTCTHPSVSDSPRPAGAGRPPTRDRVPAGRGREAIGAAAGVGAGGQVVERAGVLVEELVLRKSKTQEAARRGNSARPRAPGSPAAPCPWTDAGRSAATRRPRSWANCSWCHRPVSGSLQSVRARGGREMVLIRPARKAHRGRASP
jgi:hypothetical protein